jgi:hypothetical protein
MSDPTALRTERIHHWLHEFPEPLSRRDAEILADSEELDDALADLEATLGSDLVEGQSYAGWVRVIRDLIASVEARAKVLP